MLNEKQWQEIKRYCIPFMWLGLTIYIVANVCLPVIKHYWLLLFGNFALWILVCIFFVKVWWYKEPYKGLDIQVREPYVGFDKMPYKIDPEEVGTNPFGAAFFWHFSTVSISMKAAVHMFMGNDVQRASRDGDNEASIGMMTQEINHATAQLFYSRELEKCLGYPEGFRSLWKTILIRYFPRAWKAAFFLWVEIASMAFHLALTLLPIKAEHIFGEPAWLWTWHFMEEAECSWDYVQETSPKVPLINKAVTWVVVAFCMLCFWTQAILQGLWYGRATFWKHPSRLVTGSFMHATFFVQLLLFAIALTFLESLLGMRPDEAYQWAQVGINREYGPYSHLFKTTHTQHAGGQLIKKGRKMPPRDAILGVRVVRKRLYNKVRKMMKTSGMTEKEIKFTSFAHVAQAAKFNPLLG